MKLGKLAVWTMLDQLSAADAAAFAQRVERWGYAALWQPEGFTRNMLVQSGWLLANATSRLIVATGIVSIYARDAIAMVGAQYQSRRAVARALPAGYGRLPCAGGQRDARAPLWPAGAATDARSLTAMPRSRYRGFEPPEKPLTVCIAALKKTKMLELAAELADGLASVNVTPERAPGPGACDPRPQASCFASAKGHPRNRRRGRPGRAGWRAAEALSQPGELPAELGTAGFRRKPDWAGYRLDHLDSMPCSRGQRNAMRDRIQRQSLMPGRCVLRSAHAPSGEHARDLAVLEAPLQRLTQWAKTTIGERETGGYTIE